MFIGIANSVGKRWGGGFDPDAQAFFDRVTTAGGSLSTTEQTAVNTLVIQMKADGIWSKMKAVYPMVGASAAACAQNLKSSSFTGTFTSGWTFVSTGVTPNGSAYMNTSISPSDMGLNSLHLSYYSRTITTTTSAEMGAVESGYGETVLLPRYNSSLGDISRVNSGFPGGGVVVDSAGFFTVSRISSTGFKTFKNNSVLSNRSSATSTSSSTIPIWIGAYNLNGSLGDRTTRECAFSSIGDGLTDAEASDFYTAVQAFQTTLSRQV